ncbi:hypothetical protein S83_031450, partial [Arachis hypogaea]
GLFSTHKTHGFSSQTHTRSTVTSHHHPPSNAAVTSYHRHSSLPPPPHSAAPPQPYPAAQYGTFQGVSNYPPPPRDPHPAIGFPHPVPPPTTRLLILLITLMATKQFLLDFDMISSLTLIKVMQLLKEDLYENPALVAAGA